MIDIFNNREIAIALWVGAALIWALPKPAIRNALYSVLKALTHRLILINLGLMALYIALLAYALREAGLWDVTQLKNTLVWTVSVAAVSLFRINQISNDPHYFRNAIRDNFKLVAVLEFIIAFYTFPLWAELLIVPVSTFLVVMHAFAEEKEEHALVAKVFGNVLAAFGIGLLAYAAYRLIMEFGSFAQMQTVSDFVLPPLLSFLFLPFLFVLALYVNYGLVFLRLRYAIKEPSLRAYAKRRAPIAFHVRTGLLKRWARNMMAMNPTSKTQVIESIREVKRLRKREQNPEQVPLGRGWSPYAATRFLETEGFSTDDYHCTLYGTGEWHAASAPVKIDRGILASTITYYVEGGEFTATQLKLALNVDQPEESHDAPERLRSYARQLCEAALKVELPADIEHSLIAGENRQTSLCGKELVVSKEEWPGHRLNGYSMKFVIRNPQLGTSG